MDRAAPRSRTLCGDGTLRPAVREKVWLRLRLVVELVVALLVMGAITWLAVAVLHYLFDTFPS